MSKQTDEELYQALETIAGELKHAVKHLQRAVKKAIAYEERDEAKQQDSGRLQ